MNVPVELVGNDGRPIPPKESPVDDRTPPATTSTDNPFAGLSMEETFNRLRWDGSLGSRDVHLSYDIRAKQARKRRSKQRAAKAARKRNRK